mmetsp:Transcript_27995/g.65754  ORF Transcript_27995/g.65754 Transcript_27995/m.65754 type:complete len:203 (+) Transcript_27995:270-878(+)
MPLVTTMCGLSKHCGRASLPPSISGMSMVALLRFICSSSLLLLSLAASSVEFSESSDVLPSDSLSSISSSDIGRLTGSCNAGCSVEFARVWLLSFSVSPDSDSFVSLLVALSSFVALTVEAPSISSVVLLTSTKRVSLGSLQLMFSPISDSESLSVLLSLSSSASLSRPWRVSFLSLEFTSSNVKFKVSLEALLWFTLSSSS